jgi:hypothetical protein
MVITLAIPATSFLPVPAALPRDSYPTVDADSPAKGLSGRRLYGTLPPACASMRRRLDPRPWPDPHVPEALNGESCRPDKGRHVAVGARQDVCDDFVRWSDLAVAVVPGQLRQLEKIKSDGGAFAEVPPHPISPRSPAFISAAERNNLSGGPAVACEVHSVSW